MVIVVMKLRVVMIPISYISRLMTIWYGMSGLSTYILICITQQTIMKNGICTLGRLRPHTHEHQSPVIRCCMHFLSREPDPVVFVQTAKTDVTEQLHMLPG